MLKQKKEPSVEFLLQGQHIHQSTLLGNLLANFFSTFLIQW